MSKNRNFGVKHSLLANFNLFNKIPIHSVKQHALLTERTCTCL